MVPTAPTFFCWHPFLPDTQPPHTAVPPALSRGQPCSRSISTRSTTIRGEMGSDEPSLNLPFLIAGAGSRAFPRSARWERGRAGNRRCLGLSPPSLPPSCRSSISQRSCHGLVAGLWEAQQQRSDLNASPPTSLVKQLGIKGRKATGAPRQIATLPRGDRHGGEIKAFKS